MASATDLSGRVMKFELQSSPVEFEIISGSVDDAGKVTHYCPTGTSEIDRTVYHSRLVTYSVQGVLLTANLPFSSYKPGTQLTGVTVTLDRSAGSPKTHASTDAVVNTMKHTFDTGNHQVWEMVITADGNYTPPS